MRKTQCQPIKIRQLLNIQLGNNIGGQSNRDLCHTPWFGCHGSSIVRPEGGRDCYWLRSCFQLYIIQSLIPSHEFLVAMTTMSCTHSTQPLSPKKRGQKREPLSMNNGVSIVCSQAMHVHVYERSGSGWAPPHPQ